MATRKRVALPLRREPRLAEIGAVYAFPVLDGRFGACQVVSKGHSRGHVENVTLDYLAAERPTIEIAASLKPFRKAFANWGNEPRRCNVEERVPWWAERVGVMEPVEVFSDPCLTWGGWYAADVYNMQRWERGAQRLRGHDATQVNIDVGGGAVTVRRDSSRLSIGPGGLPVPARGRVNFEALDALPGLNDLTYEGRDVGFVDYVASRRIPKVAWRGHEQQQLDFRSSFIEKLSLEVGDEPVTLRGPETLGTLALTGQVDRLTVEGVRLAFPFSLWIEGSRLTKPPRGAEAVQVVAYTKVREGSLSDLSEYKNLAELRIWGAPGNLQDATGLLSLSALREFAIFELYSLDALNWPTNWPLLDGVKIHGLRKTDADVLKRSLAMVPDVRITGARSEEWIEANANNPFRDWEEDDPAFGRAACAAWKKARMAATNLGSPANQAEAEKLLKALVVALNRLGKKCDIDTLRREEAAEAFFVLARDLGVEDEMSAQWFDEWRDF